MNAVSYIILNLLLFSSWFILLSRDKKALSFVDRLIGAFILGLAQIILTEMSLGIVFKSLRATPLMILNLPISLFILTFCLIRIEYKSILKEIRGELINIVRTIKGDIVLSIITIIFVVFVCYIIFLGYLFPPYTWDGLWYHLPIVGFIIQSGSIQENPAPFMIDQFMNIFPKNIELFFLWNIIFLKSDIIVNLSQLLFTIMGVFTVYSIAVKLGIERRYAVYSGLLFFFTPIMILQSQTNYVDVAVSVLFLIAINFLIHMKKPSRISILLSGITAGILLGSKGSGPLFLIVLTGMIIVRELLRYLDPFKLFYDTVMDIRAFTGVLRQYLVYFLMPSILIGGYWYIKNWVLYGNPVYPMEISLMNVTIFKGHYSGIIDPAPDIILKLSPIKRLIYVWIEKVRYYLYDSRFSGLGPVWFIISLPSILFSLLYSLRHRGFRFFFVSLILIITFILYPRNWNARYVIFIVGLGAISTGMVLEYFRGNGILRVIILALAIYTAITTNSPAITPDKIREFIQLPPSRRTIVEHDPFNIHLQARQEYGYWRWIRHNISAGDVLVYTFEPLFLSPLWNGAYSNKVVYVKADSYDEWLKGLKKEKATYILVRTRSIEDRWIGDEDRLLSSYSWLGNLKRRFNMAYSDENYRIYKMNFLATSRRESNIKVQSINYCHSPTLQSGWRTSLIGESTFRQSQGEPIEPWILWSSQRMTQKETRWQDHRELTS